LRAAAVELDELDELALELELAAAARRTVLSPRPRKASPRQRSRVGRATSASTLSASSGARRSDGHSGGGGPRSAGSTVGADSAGAEEDEDEEEEVAEVDHGLDCLMVEH
jgi:hypothetical protein